MIGKTDEKISVLLSTYNGAKYIKEQLESVIKQTVTPFEIVIQDDCSQDETVQIIREMARSYSKKVRLKYMKTKKT